MGALRAALGGRPPPRGDSLASRRWVTAAVVLLLTVVIVVGTFTAPAGAATVVVSFEEVAEGQGLTTQYEDVGVRFEAQEGETAGAIVVACGDGGGYCDTAQTGQQAAITPEEDGVTPTGFGFPREPLVAVFTEPQAAVSLAVQDAGDLRGSQIATLIARNEAGDIVARDVIQFDVRTGWHQLGVSTDAAVIAEVTLTLAWEGNQNDPHNLMAVDDLQFERNEPPDAAFDVSPEDPQVGQEVTLDASASGDIDGTVEEYRWDLNGDGVIDQVAQQPTVRVSFQEPGSYTVTLQVEDDGSATASTSQTVTVEGAVARCSVSATDVEPGDRVVLDASASNAQLVRFDVDGDGDVDRIDDSDFRESIVYDEVGTFRPAVQAELDGQTDTTRCPTIVVSRSGVDGVPGADVVAGGIGGLFGLWILRRVYAGLEKLYAKLVNDDNGDDTGDDNHPPTAVIALAPDEPEPGQPVFFDGGGSTDPDADDQIASYRWTVDGRNVVSPRFVHTFLQEDDHEVTLQVVDTHGDADTAEQTVTVEATRGEFVLDSVHPDSPGDDHDNLVEEYLVFRNDGDEALDLGGWTVHDTAEAEGRVTPGAHTFTFPDAFELGPDERVSVHTGAEPEDTRSDEETDGDRQLYWNNARAIWNNDEDVIVVEDGRGHPVLAVRYRRTESDAYELEHLDVALLDGWFGRVVVSSREEAPFVSVVPAAGLGVTLVTGLAGMLWGATLLQGPVRFLQSWANITGFLVTASVTWAATTATGLLPPSFEPIVPLLLVVGSVVMTVVGGVGVVVQHVVSSVWGWVT